MGDFFIPKCYYTHMVKRLFPITILLIFVLIIVGVWKVYSDYKTAQRERLTQLQQKAEEVQVTIIEGWTTEQIAAKLASSGMFSEEEFLDAVKKFNLGSYALVMDKPSGTGLEGYLFPDTYRFAKGATPEDVITKMLSNFTNRMRSINVLESELTYTIPGYESLEVSGGDHKPGMSLYDILTLASIVEAESGSSSNMSLAEERALIAGVFYNRMLIGQGLESDATVNYITGKNDPGVSIKDTEINSPYNTYRYAGLPPGPIGNPSLGSIQAVMRPTKSEFYYFLHKQPSGEVQFSKTFAEHIQKK